jgi:hypothetical protein
MESTTFWDSTPCRLIVSFQRKILPPSSETKRKLSKEARYLYYVEYEVLTALTIFKVVISCNSERA